MKAAPQIDAGRRLLVVGDVGLVDRLSDEFARRSPAPPFEHTPSPVDVARMALYGGLPPYDAFVLKGFRNAAAHELAVLARMGGAHPLVFLLGRQPGFGNAFTRSLGVYHLPPAVGPGFIAESVLAYESREPARSAPFDYSALFK